MNVIANALFLIGLLPWLIVFLSSFMLFAAPGSSSNPLLLGAFFSLASYPVLLVIGFVKSSGFRRLSAEHARRARFAWLPLLSPIATAVFMLAIDLFCDGSFSCHR